jgi:hypothetical protein
MLSQSPGFKICTGCVKTKPRSDFYPQKDMRDGYRNNCNECHAKAHQDWYEKNRDREIERVRTWQQSNPEKVNASHRRRRALDPEQHKKRNREGHLRRKYGLTQNMFGALVLAQLGKCAVCGELTAPELHVDHDHRTNKVRGLLCGKCNKAIGLLNDDPKLMDAAKEYLERSEKFWVSTPSRSVTPR